ncbi:hypothetical protein CI102_3103 [Trichoderma harzianum]|nr:hypothetical protein CI102_3103 [Trichoderma harzianum]
MFALKAKCELNSEKRGRKNSFSMKSSIGIPKEKRRSKAFMAHGYQDTIVPAMLNNRDKDLYFDPGIISFFNSNCLILS